MSAKAIGGDSSTTNVLLKQNLIGIESGKKKVSKGQNKVITIALAVGIGAGLIIIGLGLSHHLGVFAKLASHATVHTSTHTMGMTQSVFKSFGMTKGQVAMKYVDIGLMAGGSLLSTACAAGLLVYHHREKIRDKLASAFEDDHEPWSSVYDDPDKTYQKP